VVDEAVFHRMGEPQTPNPDTKPSN
jgi:hypothetical protein